MHLIFTIPRADLYLDIFVPLLWGGYGQLESQQQCSFYFETSLETDQLLTEMFYSRAAR